MGSYCETRYGSNSGSNQDNFRGPDPVGSSEDDGFFSQDFPFEQQGSGANQQQQQICQGKNVIKTIEEVKEVKHVLVEYVAKTMEMKDQININHQKEDNFNLELETEDKINLGCSKVFQIQDLLEMEDMVKMEQEMEDIMEDIIKLEMEMVDLIKVEKEFEEIIKL